MPYRTPLRIVTRAALALAILMPLALATPASAVRVCTYNLLHWPGTDWVTRTPYFRTVMDSIDADIIIVQEMESQIGVVRFLNILNTSEPDEYWFMPFVNGPDMDNACFYKPAVLDSIFHEQLYTTVRQTSVYRLRLDGYESTGAEFTILSTHLKAGSSSSDQATRLSQTTVIRNYLNDYPPGSFFMVGGDFNMQSSGESAYQMLVGWQADNDGRTRDPIGRAGTWHDNYSYRDIHTQATRDNYGGMDDRFDQILISYSLDDGAGMDYIYDSHVAFGNDGLRFNNSINDPPNQIVSQAVADALYEASDHVPVYFDLQVPAKVDAPIDLAFGQVIVGTPGEELYTVTNVAPAPAELLTYTLAAGAGFTAPGGTFELAAGASDDHTIEMDTATTGEKGCSLVVSSNDLDTPDWITAVTGAVVEHAEASLAEGSVLLERPLDFGEVMPGGGTSQSLPVYNYGYHEFQALLEVYDAEISGGDGRFTFEGGFEEQTAGTQAADFTLWFEGAGAAPDSVYTAELVFSTRDELAVSGGTPQDDLTVHLSVYVSDGTGIPGDEVRALALSPGMPNPFTERTALHLALPEATHVRIEVYDISGRLVRTLESGVLPAGEHRVVWDGRDDRGREAASGIYFCRAIVGEWTEARKVVLMR
jgi:endonuclease/exonuclease/phosphatase family metal-dependent hydrolase